MANSSKFIKLHSNILLEWTYDSTNLISEDYNIVNDLISNKRGFMSKSGFNTLENSVFVIDPIIKKYAKINVSKYNYLKTESYSSSYIQYDNLKIHIPTTYSFSDNGYVGLYIRIYTYDYNNKNVIDFSSIIYDDTELNSNIQLTLNKEFLYDEQSWGKYITYNIPSINTVSKQRSSTTNSNTPTPNSINLNLTQSNGISETSPIFIEFSYIINREEILGNTYYNMSDIFTKSISKIPEYLQLSANVKKSNDGDYFEIYGSYGGDNESMDEFIDELNSKGRKVKIEYEVTLFEENILMNTQTYIVTENYTKKLWYRPVLSFTNTTASIDVTMKIIDLIDNSQIDRFASLSLTKDIFKYGKILTRINIDNAWKPKIYNMKNNTNVVDSALTNTNIQTNNISLTKVNYPIISDRIAILINSAPSTNDDYKSMGLAEIIINPFGNTIKFDIAKYIDDDNNVTPFNLTEILENSELTLSFKNNEEFLEKSYWQETDINDFENGIIVYRIEQSDLLTLNKISSDNYNFYLTIKSEATGIRSLLYSGKWVNFDDVTFSENIIKTTNGVDYGDFVDLEETLNTEIKTKSSTISTSTVLNQNSNSNALILLDADADINNFENYLDGLNISIWLKKATSNDNSLTYLYFLLDLTPTIIDNIKKQNGISDVISVPFCLGAKVAVDGTAVGLNTIKKDTYDSGTEANEISFN
jgi:hypothetical protein